MHCKKNHQKRAKENKTIHCPAVDDPMPGMLCPPFPHLRADDPKLTGTRESLRAGGTHKERCTSSCTRAWGVLSSWLETGESHNLRHSRAPPEARGLAIALWPQSTADRRPPCSPLALPCLLQAGPRDAAQAPDAPCTGLSIHRNTASALLAPRGCP